MKLGLILLATLCFVSFAQAQQARVVNVCGSLAPFGPQAAGTQSYWTIDINGLLCLSQPVGVSCPAGTVSLTTLTVTNGVVTHC